MLVSVITPCLNAGKWLERCLDSVASQTYPNIEHIVVDGGSTDGTVELLQRRGVRYISEPDSGQSNAINKGFRLAQGNVLGWLNADDVLLPDALERITEAFRARPSAGWTCGRCVVQREGKPAVVLPPPRHIRHTTLDAGNLLTQPGFFMTRWALAQVGDLDESFHLAMDYDLWLRLVDAGVPSVYVPGTLAVYEVHSESKTGSVRPAEFIREEAKALAKSGRKRQAGFVLGQAASASAAFSHRSLSPADVRSAVAGFLHDPRTCERDLDPDAVAAGAFVEAAMIGLHRSPAGLRHLLRFSVWRYPETRIRLIRALRFVVHTLILQARGKLARAASRPPLTDSNPKAYRLP